MEAKPWVVYTRVSTDDQAREGVSLQMQEERCAAFVLGSGYTVGEIISDDGYSGKDTHRPGMLKIFAAIEAGEIGGICIWKLDRLTRNMRDLLDCVELFDENNIGLISVQEHIDTSGPMGRFVLHLMGAVAQLERETISARVKAGMRHIMDRGGWTGGPLPLGCIVVQCDDGLRRLDVDPLTGPLVQQIWPLSITGKSTAEIAMRLSEDGLTDKKGKKITARRIASIMKNRKYVGLLVTAEDFTAAHEAMESRTNPQSSRIKKMSDHVFILAGVARCAHCQASMTPVHARGSSGVYAYYRCHNKSKKGKEVCAAKDVPALAWEQAVLEAIVASSNDYEQIIQAYKKRLDVVVQITAPASGQHKELTMHRDKLLQQSDYIMDRLLESEDRGKPAYERRLSKIQEEIEKLEREMASCESGMELAEMRKIEVEAIPEMLKQATETLESCAPEEQENIIKWLLDAVYLSQASEEIQLTYRIPKIPDAKNVEDFGSTKKSKWYTMMGSNHRPAD